MPPKRIIFVARQWEGDLEHLDAAADDYYADLRNFRSVEANKTAALTKDIHDLLELITHHLVTCREAANAAGAGYHKPTILLLADTTLAAVYHVTNRLGSLANAAADGTFKLWLSEDVRARATKAQQDFPAADSSLLQPGKRGVPDTLASYVKDAIDHADIATTTTIILASANHANQKDTALWESYEP
ncbi:hypothetical protein CH35J_012848 [Colletotrichum higginsianum]|uniref:Uncharacterized protein n=1 Tax=Colletotrichum higginsianum TaxID=80884 RepID=A0A4T0VC71_9PEZI|nr:hypothetical protein CH35J_012848 [Colletotrichum higginsianum]